MVLFIAFFGLAVGGGLMLLLARYAPHPNASLNAAARALPGGGSMPFDEFRALLIDLLDALKLEIVLITGGNDHLDVIVRSSEPMTGGRFLVHAILEAPGDIVDQTYVLRLADHARGDNVG